MRGDPKPPVVARQESFKHALRLVEAARASQPELTGEPVLERSPKPLHAALGLGRASQDELDPELFE